MSEEQIIEHIRKAWIRADESLAADGFTTGEYHRLIFEAGYRAAIANNYVREDASELERLRAFAQKIMKCWPDGDVDGGFLQDTAAEFGLLKETTAAGPCGENCLCADYGDFPQRCFRPTALLTGRDGGQEQEGSR